MLCSYEDQPSVLRHIADNLVEKANPSTRIPAALSLMPMRGFPMFGPPDDQRGTGALYNAEPRPKRWWKRTWSEIERMLDDGRKDRAGPGFVVIDPATSAFVGDDSRVSAVRSFLDAIRIEIERIGCGVIIVAHPSKAGVRGGEKGAEAVAGSPAWIDASRGVIAFKREEGGEEMHERPAFEVSVEKANYGPSWNATRRLFRVTNGPFEEEHPSEAEKRNEKRIREAKEKERKRALRAQAAARKAKKEAEQEETDDSENWKVLD